MKITSKGFLNGYNALTTEGDHTQMNMDFGILCMRKGDRAAYHEAKECIYVLITGKVTFRWNGKQAEVHRKSCFHEDPVLLHVPKDTEVTIESHADDTEIGIQKTSNPKTFEAKLLQKDDLLSASEMRGSGLMNEASTRIVRTFLDRSTCPETNFFIGEVVSFPGKWSSYPPHSHVEPEIYYYKFLPESGYGFAEVGDDVYKVRNNDLTAMANGVTHSQSTAPGYAEYYIWAIRLQDDVAMQTNVVPEHAWVAEPGAKYFPEI